MKHKTTRSEGSPEFRVLPEFSGKVRSYTTRVGPHTLELIEFSGKTPAYGWRLTHDESGDVRSLVKTTLSKENVLIVLGKAIKARSGNDLCHTEIELEKMGLAEVVERNN